MTPARGARRRRRGTAPRDQGRSHFGVILERLLEAMPGARAAALVDLDGETVDYAGSLDPFDVKVAAAHWQIVLSDLRSRSALGGVRQLLVRSGTQSYLIRGLNQNYSLVLVLHARAAFSASERALDEADSLLSAEAGWPAPRRPMRWFRVEVETDPADRTRPIRLHASGSWQPVEIMGYVASGLSPRERGFRIRLPTGAEMILVRERLGRWFADELVAT